MMAERRTTEISSHIPLVVMHTKFHSPKPNRIDSRTYIFIYMFHYITYYNNAIIIIIVIIAQTHTQH